MNPDMEKGVDTQKFLRIVEISGFWKIDYSFFWNKTYDDNRMPIGMIIKKVQCACDGH